MAVVLQAFQGIQTFTITSLNSLASSLTAGWGSAAVDNSATLYLDAFVQVNLAAVNTAPASLKAVYVYAYGLTDPAGTNYTNTGAASGVPGTQGALTFPDITANPVNMPLIGVVPTSVQNIAMNSPPFSVAKAFGGWMPQKWGVAIVNASGVTIAASGNSVQYTGIYNTVV
jgi:hypothetical protein